MTQELISKQKQTHRHTVQTCGCQGMGKGRVDWEFGISRCKLPCICITESMCCTPEINTTLLTSYISIKWTKKKEFCFNHVNLKESVIGCPRRSASLVAEDYTFLGEVGAGNIHIPLISLFPWQTLQVFSDIPVLHRAVWKLNAYLQLAKLNLHNFA